MLGVAGDGRAVIGALVNTDRDHPLGTALFEREPGSAAWLPMASPFAPSIGLQLFGGRGHELVAVTRTQTTLPGQQLYSETVSASLLTTATSGVTSPALAPPATPERTGIPTMASTSGGVAPKVSKVAVTRVTLALVGKCACRSARTPCRTARSVRLALKLPKAMTRVRVAVQRLRAGRWRGLRVLTLRPVNGKARVRLPLGRLRLETSPAHDNLPHPWVAYLIVH
jgi:hypothetical protein